MHLRATALPGAPTNVPPADERCDALFAHGRLPASEGRGHRRRAVGLLSAIILARPVAAVEAAAAAAAAVAAAAAGRRQQRRRCRHQRQVERPAAEHKQQAAALTAASLLIPARATAIPCATIDAATLTAADEAFRLCAS